MTAMINHIKNPTIPVRPNSATFNKNISLYLLINSIKTMPIKKGEF